MLCGCVLLGLFGILFLFCSLIAIVFVRTTLFKYSDRNRHRVDATTIFSECFCQNMVSQFGLKDKKLKVFDKHFYS